MMLVCKISSYTRTTVTAGTQKRRIVLPKVRHGCTRKHGQVRDRKSVNADLQPSSSSWLKGEPPETVCYKWAVVLTKHSSHF